MRRAGSLLLAAALLPAAAPPSPLDAHSVARDVLELVVRSTTAVRGRASETGPLCVQRGLGGVSVIGRGWRGNDSLFESWLRPDDGLALLVGDMEAIRGAIRTARSASTQRRWLRRVESSWLPPSLAFCANGTDQRLAFGSPTIVGDMAFVTVTLECRQHCGYAYGDRIALRRAAGGWEIVARHRDFIS